MKCFENALTYRKSGVYLSSRTRFGRDNNQKVTEFAFGQEYLSLAIERYEL